MPRELFAVALAVDDDLVTGVGQSIQGAIDQHRIGNWRQSFLDRAI